MKRQFNNKRFWLIVGAVAVVETLLLCLIFQWKYIFPSQKVSELYTRYENVDGIDASFIKDYRVNDTFFVDVTLLETKDTALWNSLCGDLDIAPFSMYPKEYREKMSTEHSFGQRVMKDTFISENDSLYKEDLIIFSHINMSMCIFHNINGYQYDAIVNEKHKKITF